MFTLVAYYWLNVIISWTRFWFHFFESFRFTYCSLEFLLLLELIITHSCCVFRDEVGPCWFGDCRASSCLNSLRNGVSTNSRMISNKCGWFCSRNRILWPLLNFNFICSWGWVIDDFIVGFIGRCRNHYIFIIFRLICMWIILNNWWIYIGWAWMLISFKHFPLLFWNTVFMATAKLRRLGVRWLKIFDKCLRSQGIVLKASLQFHWKWFSNLSLDCVIEFRHLSIISGWIR